VIHQPIAKLTSNSFLQLFNISAAELYDVARLNINQMVMVLGRILLLHQDGQQTQTTPGQ